MRFMFIKRQFDRLLIVNSKASEVENIGNHMHSSYISFLIHNNWRRKFTLSLQHTCHLTSIIPAMVTILSIRNKIQQFRYDSRTANVNTPRKLPKKDWYRSELGSGTSRMATKKGDLVTQDSRLEQPLLSKCGVSCLMLCTFCARLASCDCNEWRSIVQGRASILGTLVPLLLGELSA